MFTNMKGAIFDLDGVLVNTAKYHYLAWKRLARELGFEFSEVDNERLKGVSRTESLEILLKIGGLELDENEKLLLSTKKNEWYKAYIENMSKCEILPGVKEYLTKLKYEGVKIALGSSSKNAPIILNKLGIQELFNAVIDGNSVINAKPDPEVFLQGARALGLNPSECVVFEDAEAGVTAGKRAGMKVIGIGKKENLPQADMIIDGICCLL